MLCGHRGRETDQNRVAAGYTATEHIRQQNGVETVSRQRERSKHVPREDTRQRNTGGSKAVSRNRCGREKHQTHAAVGELSEAEVMSNFFLTGVRQNALFMSPFFTELGLDLSLDHRGGLGSGDRYRSQRGGPVARPRRWSGIGRSLPIVARRVSRSTTEVV
jgi:hypothetical protein